MNEWTTIYLNIEVFGNGEGFDEDKVSRKNELLLKKLIHTRMFSSTYENEVFS
jgi:hypothetical protein